MKASMATVSCLLLLLLLLPIALRSEAEFSPRSPYHPAECCFTYVTRAIPRWRILGYYESSSQCVNPGIVERQPRGNLGASGLSGARWGQEEAGLTDGEGFITKKGHVICANPRDDWVQDYIQELEKI
ncbi:C-C motif chemokine 14 precursor [Camelus ferus]|nr:C-C motif chemokine 14 precursor [Camelus ferus]